MDDNIGLKAMVSVHKYPQCYPFRCFELQYYIALYNLKSNKEEYGDRNHRVAQTILHRLLRIQHKIVSGKDDTNDEGNDFVKGLY